MCPLVKRHPKYKLHMICVGWLLCILGLVAGSFADTLPSLIITQGLMYGGSYSLISKSILLLRITVGFVVFYYPIISMVNEWWVGRRGMAWGVIVSAGGVTGVVMPFIVGQYQFSCRTLIFAQTLNYY